MSFTTFKFSFVADWLPRRFSWLRHHRSYVSVDDNSMSSGPSLRELVYTVTDRLLADVMRRATVEEFDQNCFALQQQQMDWTGSAFDVFGIDVEFDRFVAAEVASAGGEEARPE
jgi:hypothetical protein